MSNQQNAYLKAMGIDVWIERSPSNTSSPETSQPITSQPITSDQVESNVKQVEPAPIPANKTEPVIVPDNKVDVDQLDWPALHSSVAECHACSLSKSRTKTIFGAGNQTAALMLIGDAPSAEDELQGGPFSGQAGKLLTAMLKAMGYQRNDVYISNLVKCRTSENQDPTIEEVTACESYLVRQIKLVRPDLILVLGSVAAQLLLKSKSTLSRLRGQLHYIENINIPVIVSFDPAYLLRSPNEKRKAWDDLQTVMKELSNIATSKK